MLALFSDAAIETSDVKLIGVIVVLVGTIAWVLKSAVPAMVSQYRADVFSLQKEYKDSLAAAVRDFSASLDKVCDRHDRELAKRDAQIERLADAVEKLCSRVEDIENGHRQDRKTPRSD